MNRSLWNIHLRLGPLVMYVGRQAAQRKTIMKTTKDRKTEGGEKLMTMKEREEGIERLIEQNIYACQSMLVDTALSNQWFVLDDIENMYRPFDGLLLKPSVCVSCSSDSLCLDSETGECSECFEENRMPQEIFEWWLVSPWLSKQLLFAGEPLLDNAYGRWWGRCTTGQAIGLDDVIEQIYEELNQSNG